MGRLSHIDDAEQRQTQEATAPEQAAVPQPQTTERAERAQRTAEQTTAPQTRTSAAVAQHAHKSAAQEDMDFHGLGEAGEKSSGHTALIILAVVILVVIVFHIVGYNSSL